MIGELTEHQAGASQAPERPDSRAQAFQRNSGASALRGAWDPPDLSWLLLGAQRCSWTAPGLSGPAWGGSGGPRLGHASFSVTLARLSLAWVLEPLGLPLLLLAAPGWFWTPRGHTGHRLGATALGRTQNDSQQRDFKHRMRKRKNFPGHWTGSQAWGTPQRIQNQRLEASASGRISHQTRKTTPK